MDDLISRLSELRCQYNCFDENERDAYRSLSEAIEALSEQPERKKGKTMSRYGDSDYDDMFYELDKFLKSHKPSELLTLVQEAVEWWEERTDDVHSK